ncbi:MAG: hypothetical protein AAF587_22390 [Bacteroidota bacterium]
MGARERQLNFLKQCGYLIAVDIDVESHTLLACLLLLSISGASQQPEGNN